MIDVSELASKHSEMISNTVEYCLREYMLANYYIFTSRVLSDVVSDFETLILPDITCVTQRWGDWNMTTYSDNGEDIFMVWYNGLEVRMAEYWGVSY